MDSLSINRTSGVSSSQAGGATAAPFVDTGAALSRLGASPAAAISSGLNLPSPGQLATQLLTTLALLMTGLPNPVSAKPPSTAAKAERIEGGPSLYEGKGMFHKGAPGAPDTYAFENSPQGIKWAAEHGYKSIDLDMQITKDGVLVATHWSKPMEKDGFFDPAGKLKPDTKVSEMTFAEVSRLRNKDGQSQIYPMSQMIQELKKNNIAGDLEAKDDPRFATDKVMGEIADMVRDAGIKANLKSIDRGEGSMDILEKAQEYGFWVRTAKGNGKEGRHIGYGE